MSGIQVYRLRKDWDGPRELKGRTRTTTLMLPPAIVGDWWAGPDMQELRMATVGVSARDWQFVG